MSYTITVGVDPLVIQDQKILAGKPWFWEKGYMPDGFYKEVYGMPVFKTIENKQKFPIDVTSSEASTYLNPITLPFCQVTNHLTVKLKDYRECIRTGESFCVWMSFNLPTFDLENQEKIDFPLEIKEGIAAGKVKVVFTCYPEAGLRLLEALDFVQRFAQKFSLSKESFLVITANLGVQTLVHRWEDHRGVKLQATVVDACCFEFSSWFFVDPNNRTLDLEKSTKKFTFLARRLCLERLALVSFLESRIGKENAYYSLGNPYAEADLTIDPLPRSIKKDIMTYTRGKKPNLLLRTNSLLRSLDDEDCRQITNHASDISEYCYQSLIEIVSETVAVSCDDVIFFSEKIWKPIYVLKPFILYGNVGSLRKLREMGYKTFNKWWDESYDLIQDPWERLEAVEQVIVRLNQRSVEDLKKIVSSEEFQEVLHHNRNLFISRNLNRNPHIDTLVAFLGQSPGEDFI